MFIEDSKRLSVIYLQAPEKKADSTRSKEPRNDALGIYLNLTFPTLPRVPLGIIWDKLQA